MRVEFFPAAEQELTEAVDYYESKLRGLGAEFAEETERIVALLGARRRNRASPSQAAVLGISSSGSLTNVSSRRVQSHARLKHVVGQE
jgi:hypothetical protein